MYSPLFWIEWLDRLDRVLTSARQDVALLKRTVSPRSLEAIAKRKGWAPPQRNPDRASSQVAGTEARNNANFIIGQLSWHQATIEQYRAQIAGKGDPELKRTLRKALPVYEKNRDLLLTLKP